MICMSVNETKKPNTSFIKKCLFLKIKLKPTFHFFLKSAKTEKSPLRHYRRKPFHFPLFSEKSTNFSVKKLVDKFCECRHRLLTQVFQTKNIFRKKVICHQTKKVFRKSNVESFISIFQQEKYFASVFPVRFPLPLKSFE